MFGVLMFVPILSIPAEAFVTWVDHRVTEAKCRMDCSRMFREMGRPPCRDEEECWMLCEPIIRDPVFRDAVCKLCLSSGCEVACQINHKRHRRGKRRKKVAKSECSFQNVSVFDCELRWILNDERPTILTVVVWGRTTFGEPVRLGTTTKQSWKLAPEVVADMEYLGLIATDKTKLLDRAKVDLNQKSILCLSEETTAAQNSVPSNRTGLDVVIGMIVRPPDRFYWPLFLLCLVLGTSLILAVNLLIALRKSGKIERFEDMSNPFESQSYLLNQTGLDSASVLSHDFSVFTIYQPQPNLLDHDQVWISAETRI